MRFKAPILLVLCVGLIFGGSPIFAEDLSKPSTSAPLSDPATERMDSGGQPQDPGATNDEASPDNNGRAPLDSMQIRLPSEITFVIDPYEINGRGQVYSEPIVVKNNSDSTVRVSLNHARCINISGGEIAFLTHPAYAGASPKCYLDSGAAVLAHTGVKDSGVQDPSEDDEEKMERRKQEPKDSGPAERPSSSRNASQKRIQLFLRRCDSPDKRAIILTEEFSEPWNFVLDPGEEAVFEIGGTVNPSPKLPWKAGDIRVAASFGIEPIRTRRVPLDNE